MQNCLRVLRKGIWRTLIIFKMPFYAVARGRTPGIFMTWADCEAQVKGFSGARYKKFDVITAAQEFVAAEGGGVSNNTAKGKQVTKGSSNVNGKRSYSSSNNQQSKYNANSNNNKEKQSANKFADADSTFDSDDSDDLGSIIGKQLDDLEKRVNNFEKGITKIYNQGSRNTQKKTILLEPPKKRSRKSCIQFDRDNDNFVHVYTDGACSSNGKNGARAGLGVFWANGHPLNTSEPVSGRATNNCGEIQAATKAIKLALQNGVTKLAINTDSKFVINSVTKWMPNWKRKGWKLQSGEPVKNQVDFMELDSVLNKLQIKWNYVEAHKGIHGNEMADQLAKAGAAAYNLK